MSEKHVLIAPLSTEPQAVTILLDWLLAQRYPITEVIIVHTAGIVIQPSIDLLDHEFSAKYYPASIRYRRCPILGIGSVIDDIRNDNDISAFLKTLYQTLKEARKEYTVIHLSIVRGRKTMVAAQLLFREHDNIWHMVSNKRNSENVKQMHIDVNNDIHVLQVPVLRWSDAATVSAILEADDPWRAIERQRHFSHHEKIRRQREFLERYLTSMEKNLLIALCQHGFDNAGLAKALNKQEQTIANQLSRIYRKFDEWRELPAGSATRSALIAEFAPYLTQVLKEKI